MAWWRLQRYLIKRSLCVGSFACKLCICSFQTCKTALAGNRTRPPAWQARILPLNHQCQHFPTPGIEPGPPVWKPGILTTRQCRSWRSFLRRFAKILCRLGLSWYCSWNLTSLKPILTQPFTVRNWKNLLRNRIWHPAWISTYRDVVVNRKRNRKPCSVWSHL